VRVTVYDNGKAQAYVARLEEPTGVADPYTVTLLGFGLLGLLAFRLSHKAANPHVSKGSNC
jgi:hypothetical protein